MTKKEKNKYEVGKWYKDQDGDFVKFSRFEDSWLGFTAEVVNGMYSEFEGGWGETQFPKCIPMTIDEMKKYLPEHEWWTEHSNELFPIY